MSENVKTMPTPEDETKSMTVAIDVGFAIAGFDDTHEYPLPEQGTIYILINGIPKDLPAEYEDTVLKTARSQLMATLSSLKWIEVYPKGKSARDGAQPTFVNLEHVISITFMSDVRKF